MGLSGFWFHTIWDNFINNWFLINKYWIITFQLVIQLKSFHFCFPFVWAKSISWWDISIKHRESYENFNAYNIPTKPYIFFEQCDDGMIELIIITVIHVRKCSYLK